MNPPELRQLMRGCQHESVADQDTPRNVTITRAQDNCHPGVLGEVGLTTNISISNS